VPNYREGAGCGYRLPQGNFKELLRCQIGENQRGGGNVLIVKILSPLTLPFYSKEGEDASNVMQN
jgi:hypothetical protein